jgi:hypothetical protein
MIKFFVVMDDLFEHNKPASSTALAMLNKVKNRYAFERGTISGLGILSGHLQKNWGG